MFATSATVRHNTKQKYCVRPLDSFIISLLCPLGKSNTSYFSINFSLSLSLYTSNEDGSIGAIRNTESNQYRTPVDTMYPRTKQWVIRNAPFSAYMEL